MKQYTLGHRARVIVFQEYIARYREPFWEQAIAIARTRGIDLKVGAGRPAGKQARRNDSTKFDGLLQVKQFEAVILGLRLSWRRMGKMKKDVDLVILEQARRNLDVYRYLLPRRSDYMIAMWGHGKDYVGKERHFLSWLMKILTHRMDWFFSYTEGGKEAVAESGFPRDRISVVLNSVDTATLKKDMDELLDIDVRKFLARHSLTPSTALFIGALDASKRIQFLLDAARLAHIQDPKFRLLMSGDGPLRPLVERTASTVDWLVYIGQIRGEHKAMAMRAASIIAIPGRVGLVAVDSLASGVPIVTTDWPWHAPEFEYLQDGRTCLVTENTEEAFARSMIQLLNDKDALRNFDHEGKSDSEDYTVERMADRFITGIENALGYAKGASE